MSTCPTRCCSTSRTSPGRSPTTGGCCRWTFAPPSTSRCWPATSSACTRPRYVHSFLECVEAFTDAEVDRRDATVRYRGRTVQVRAYPISVDPAEFERLAASDEVIAARAAGAGGPSREAAAAGRSHRPVQERRARFPGVRPVPARPPRVARAGHDAGVARPLAAGDPRVRGVRRCDPAGRRARSTTATT